MIRRIAILLGLLLLVAVPSSAQVQPAPTLRILGLSPQTPPADSLAFRRALAYAIDKEAIIKAVALTLPGRTLVPALGIQHPRLAGFNPAVRGHAYDPARAKALLNESGWSGPIRIFVGPATNRFLGAFYPSLASTMSDAIGVTGGVQPVANFDSLVRSAIAGGAAIYTFSWVSDP